MAYEKGLAITLLVLAIFWIPVMYFAPDFLALVKFLIFLIGIFMLFSKVMSIMSKLLGLFILFVLYPAIIASDLAIGILDLINSSPWIIPGMLMLLGIIIAALVPKRVVGYASEDGAFVSA